MTASLLKSLRLFSVFWPSSIMLYFGWSPLVPLFPSFSVPLIFLWELFRAHYLQVISPSLSCYIFVFSSLVRCKYFTFFYIYPMVRQDVKVYCSAGSHFLLLLTSNRSGRLAKIRWSAQNIIIIIIVIFIIIIIHKYVCCFFLEGSRFYTLILPNVFHVHMKILSRTLLFANSLRLLTPMLCYRSDNKSPLISRTFLDILAELNIDVFWILFFQSLLQAFVGPFQAH